jgi:hypothetical protein
MATQTKAFDRAATMQNLRDYADKCMNATEKYSILSAARRYNDEEFAELINEIEPDLMVANHA